MTTLARTTEETIQTRNNMHAGKVQGRQEHGDADHQPAAGLRDPRECIERTIEIRYMLQDLLADHYVIRAGRDLWITIRQVA
jgi:hypothetical protein